MAVTFSGHYLQTPWKHPGKVVTDAVTLGFVVRVRTLAKLGKVSFYAVQRSSWAYTNGCKSDAPLTYHSLKARAVARLALADIADGASPREPKLEKRRAAEQRLKEAESRYFGAVCEQGITKYLERADIRRGENTDAVVRRELLPKWTDWSVADIRQRIRLPFWLSQGPRNSRVALALVRVIRIIARSK